MPTNFPISADNFPNPNPTSSLDSPSHASQHANANDAIEAVETYLLANTFTSPTLLGTPVSTTAAADTDTTQIATTEYVLGQVSTTTPQQVSNISGSVGTSLKYARADHRHEANPYFQSIDLFTVLANGTTAMNLADNKNVQVTPNATATFTTTVGVSEGTLGFLRILTSGTTSYTITFGSGFRTQSTLATGTVSARTFMLTFIYVGSAWTEISRTTAMA
jgi:hypothetical protein